MSYETRIGAPAAPTRPARASRRRQPQIVVDTDTHARLYVLADMALHSDPETAFKLLNELDRANIVLPAALPDNAVTIGRKVTYTDESTGVARTFELVWPSDADVEAQKVSVITPIGAALIGLCTGQRILWQMRGGDSTLLRVDRVEDATEVPAA